MSKDTCLRADPGLKMTYFSAKLIEAFPEDSTPSSDPSNKIAFELFLKDFELFMSRNSPKNILSNLDGKVLCNVLENVASSAIE